MMPSREKSLLKRKHCSIYLQLLIVVSAGLLFLTHLVVSVYLTILYRSFNATLCSLSLTLFCVIWMICFIIISCLLLQYFQADIINVLSDEIRDRSNFCFLFIVLFYYCSFGLIVIVTIPTLLPLITTGFCVYYYHSTFILNQYAIKKEWFICCIAYHLGLMIPQFIIQCIFYQTTIVKIEIVHYLHWLNMIIFMFYIILIAIISVINQYNFTEIYYCMEYSKSLLIKSQIKCYIMTIILELTLVFYFIFTVQILNVNIWIFTEIEIKYLPIPTTKAIGGLCGNYFIFSVPFSMIGIISYYFKKSNDSYLEIWSQCMEIYGYQTIAMFDQIYCINHICFHKQITSESTTTNSDDETANILSYSSRNAKMNKHYQCDQMCLNYQRHYLQGNKKSYRKSVILELFGHLTPFYRIRKWINDKTLIKHGRNRFFNSSVMNLKRILIIIYVISRIISVLFTVIICNWFLFSYDIDIRNDNIALNVMRLLGIFYVMILMIWIYYLFRLYYFEYMVGYITKAMNEISITNNDEGIKRIKLFKKIMNTNYIINKYVGYSDIASLICLYLFYPKRTHSSLQDSKTIPIAKFLNVEL